MFLSTYEGVRLIVFPVAVQRDPIHKSDELLFGQKQLSLDTFLGKENAPFGL